MAVYVGHCATIGCCSDWRSSAWPTSSPLLRLLPVSDRDKDAEILALRHQITVLERHLHGDLIRFTFQDSQDSGEISFTATRVKP